MKTRHLMAGLTALALTVSGAAFADNIYKWTDDEGNVHYGDAPPAARPLPATKPPSACMKISWHSCAIASPNTLSTIAIT